MPEICIAPKLCQISTPDFGHPQKSYQILCNNNNILMIYVAPIPVNCSLFSKFLYQTKKYQLKVIEYRKSR